MGKICASTSVVGWELIGKGRWQRISTQMGRDEGYGESGSGPIGSNFANFAELRKAAGERAPFSLVTRPLDNVIDIDTVAITHCVTRSTLLSVSLL